MVRVTLDYEDHDNGISHNGDLAFDKNDINISAWTFPYKHRNKLSYSWTANYFMLDGMEIRIGPRVTSDTTFVLLDALQ